MSQEGTVMSLETKERGFAIRKDVSEKDGQHVQLDLDIASTHAAESIVTIEESVPPGTEHSQIGFLPDHEPVEWDLADDGTLLLSARLEPEGSRRIIYGLRDIEPSEADPLGNEPRVVEVGGPAAEEAAASADSEAQQSAAEAAAAAAEEDTEGGEVAAIEPPLDEETAEAIAEAVEPHLDGDTGGGPDTDPVTETKVSQLQEDVADMRAYLPAFEEFLGETGRADDILTELDNIKSRIEDLEDGPDDLVETVEDVDDRLATIEERVAGIDTWRAAVADAAQPPQDLPSSEDVDTESDGEGGDAEANAGEDSEAEAEAETETGAEADTETGAEAEIEDEAEAEDGDGDAEGAEAADQADEGAANHGGEGDDAGEDQS